jgi:Flp pilus assembly protein TadD
MANLGRRLVIGGRFGEAIGLLRRALALGHPESEILPLLGRAFFKQEKYLAARALLEKCRLYGYEDGALSRDLHDVQRLFDEIGVDWNVPQAAEA